MLHLMGIIGVLILELIKLLDHFDQLLPVTLQILLVQILILILIRELSCITVHSV